MNYLTKEEKIEIVLIVGENYKTHREAATIFNERHPNKRICQSTVTRILQKFKYSGSVDNKFKVPHNPWVNVEERQLQVMQTIVETPRTPLREIAQLNAVSSTTARRILKTNKFRPYKPKFIHTLQDRDLDGRLYFSFWIQAQIEEDRSFIKHVLFSDESTFSSNGTVSSQNCRWWADENPHFVIEARDQYSFKTNVWCGIFNNQIIGPFFRENLNSERYLHFLQNDFFNVIEDIPLDLRRNMYFQQDGAPAHSTVEVRNFLDHLFPHRWIGRFSENPWPPRSPDLTPCDFFLWGYLKNEVYKHRPFRDIGHLENTIRECAAQVSPVMLRDVSREMYERTILCIQKERGRVEI